MIYVIRIITFAVVILAVTACESTTDDNLTQKKIIELENKIQELLLLNDNLQTLNSELRDKKLEKDAELSNIRGSLDFDLDLINSNIEEHYGAFNQGVWGVYGHTHSGYIKTILNRLFYTQDYWWVEGGRVENNPVENMLFKEEFMDHLLGIKFVNPISSKVKSFPPNIKEVVLYAKENNKVFMLDDENKWYEYNILGDNHLKTDFNLLHLIIESYNEWLNKP
jgi:hypothetical protein